MFNRKSLRGSSSAGLLTATAIFAALLFYANQYGFKSPEADSELTATGNTDAPDGSMVEQSPQLVEIPRGIFNTPTLSAEQTQAVEPMPANTSLETDPGAAPIAAGMSEPPVKPENRLAQTPTMAVHQAAGSSESYMTYPYAGAQQFDSWQAIQARQGAAADLNARHRGQGYGYSRGHGAADGEGEFALSMNFRSRARMDADFDADSDVTARSAADTYYGQQHSGYAQPYLNYYRAY